MGRLAEGRCALRSPSSLRLVYALYVYQDTGKCPERNIAQPRKGFSSHAERLVTSVATSSHAIRRNYQSAHCPPLSPIHRGLIAQRARAIELHLRRPQDVPLRKGDYEGSEKIRTTSSALHITRALQGRHRVGRPGSDRIAPECGITIIGILEVATTGRAFAIITVGPVEYADTAWQRQHGRVWVPRCSEMGRLGWTRRRLTVDGST